MTNHTRNTTTGLKFEKKTKIVRDGVDVSKGKFKRYIEEHGGQMGNWQRQPDAAFIWPEDKELVVYEKKFQTTKGSADEKLAAGPFILSQYRKMAKTIEIPPERVSLIYILSDYFRAPKYIELLEFLEENGVMYVFWSDEEDRERMLNFRV